MISDIVSIYFYRDVKYISATRHCNVYGSIIRYYDTNKLYYYNKTTCDRGIEGISLGIIDIIILYYYFEKKNQKRLS